MKIRSLRRLRLVFHYAHLVLVITSVNAHSVPAFHKLHAVRNAENIVLIVIHRNRASYKHSVIGKLMVSAVDVFVHKVCFYHKGIFSPVAVKLKQSKPSRAIHIMLYCPDVYGLLFAHIFSISSTPAGIVLSTLIS